MTEWHASDYHRQSSLQQAMAQEQLGRLTLDGGERVLDVGCGDGKVTAEIAARVPRGSVLGVDPSRDMIAFATSRYGPPAHANLQFEVADARHLAYQNEFDLVVSFNALHWVPEQLAALRSIRAALKPGGRALLRQVPDGPRKSLEDVIEEVRQQPRWAGNFVRGPNTTKTRPGIADDFEAKLGPLNFRRPYAHFSLDAYRALAEQAGFQVVRLQIEDKAWDFKTREGFVGFCRATFVEWTQHLPENERETFISDVLDRYESVAADNPQEANTFKFYQLDAELTAC